MGRSIIGKRGCSMIYTKEMQLAVRKIKKPYPALRVGFVDCGGYLGVRVWENQIMSMGIDERVSVLEYLNLVENTLKSFGIQVVQEGAKGDPPR